MKKVVLGVLTGATVLGFITIVVGFALGGRIGQMFVSNNQFIYSAGGKDFVLGDVPYRLFDNMNGVATSISSVTGSDFELDDFLDSYSGENSYEDNYDEHGNGHMGGRISGGAPNVTSSEQLNGVTKVSVEIAAGKVNIELGDVPGVVVKNAGKINYKSIVEEKEWRIFTTNNLGSHMLNGNNSAEYNIVLPKTATELYLEIGAGKAVVGKMNLNKAKFIVDAGKLEISGGQIKEADFEANAGNINVENLVSDKASIESFAGKVILQGDVKMLEVECETGKVELKLKKRKAYDWKTKTEIGTIKIDGENCNNGFGTNGDLTAKDKAYYDIVCEVGKVELDFE